MASYIVSIHAVLTANRGKTAPNRLRMMVLAAIAEAANMRYESIAELAFTATKSRQI